MIVHRRRDKPYSALGTGLFGPNLADALDDLDRRALPNQARQEAADGCGAQPIAAAIFSPLAPS
jgi:hypothetical protein